MSQNESAARKIISTLIFDVDDTLYDVSTGFTTHRNTDGAVSFMVDRLNFSSREEAQALRDEYFERFHATAKALKVAEADGRFPPNAPKYEPKDLSEYWAENLNFALLGPSADYANAKSTLESLQSEHPEMNLVAFSNGPRKYVLRVLREMGLDEIFPERMVFGVDDILPYCKPEPDSFKCIFERVGDLVGKEIVADQCVMFEDSMKNIRAAKELGMKTVLIAGKGRLSGGYTAASAAAAEATKPGDAPVTSDPAVDVAVEVVADIKVAIPGLWHKIPTFP